MNIKQLFDNIMKSGVVMDYMVWNGITTVDFQDEPLVNFEMINGIEYITFLVGTPNGVEQRIGVVYSVEIKSLVEQNKSNDSILQSTDTLYAFEFNLDTGDCLTAKYLTNANPRLLISNDFNLIKGYMKNRKICVSSVNENLLNIQKIADAVGRIEKYQQEFLAIINECSWLYSTFDDVSHLYQLCADLELLSDNDEAPEDGTYSVFDPQSKQFEGDRWVEWDNLTNWERFMAFVVLVLDLGDTCPDVSFYK